MHLAQVWTDFQVSAPNLAQEIIAEGESPSMASGVSQSRYHEHSDVDDSITWMLDDEHSSTVTHYCGTLAFPPAEGKHVATLSAFQHFSYLESNKAILFADLQGEILR